MWGSLIAVLGTLAGAVVAGIVQQRAARTERAEARYQERQRDQVQAVTGLVTALADHRRAMWTREQLRLAGADPDGGAYTEAKTASHATRAAVTPPLVTLSVLAPALAEPATSAVRAVYSLRAAADLSALGAARAAAVAAAERLVAAAGRELG